MYSTGMLASRFHELTGMVNSLFCVRDGTMVHYGFGELSQHSRCWVNRFILSFLQALILSAGCLSHPLHITYRTSVRISICSYPLVHIWWIGLMSSQIHCGKREQLLIDFVVGMQSFPFYMFFPWDHSTIYVTRDVITAPKINTDVLNWNQQQFSVYPVTMFRY